MSSSDNRYSEEIELIAKRADFVEYLWNNPRRKRDIVDDLDYSRSTVNRAIGALEDAGFVKDEGNKHVSTLAGKHAADRYRAYILESSTIISAREVLQPLDSTSLSSKFLLDAETDSVSGPAPKQPVEHLIGLSDDASTVSALLPSLSDKRELELLLGLCSQRGIQVELTFASESLGRIIDRYPELIRGLSDDERSTIRMGSVPEFALYLVESDEQTSLLIIVYDETQSAHGVLKTSAGEAIEEAKALLQSFNAEATDAREEIEQKTVELQSPPVVEFSQWNHSLPLELEEEGFVELQSSYFENRAALPPITGIRVGLSLNEVRLGYALEREAPRDNDREPVVHRLLSMLEEGSDCAVVGPPGSGKSTLCKLVANRWFEEFGSVLYRETGQGGPFSSPAHLRDYLQNHDDRVLVVVEDAVREDANGIFAIMEQFREDSEVVFLLDSRAEEWESPHSLPVDARMAEYKQNGICRVEMPEVDLDECERFIEHIERLTEQSLDLQASDLLDDLHTTEDGNASPGTTLLLLHNIALYADPMATFESPIPSGLIEDVQRTHRILRDAENPYALDVGVLVSLLNILGIEVQRDLLYTLSPDESKAIDGAIDLIEGRLLFTPEDVNDSRSYRTVHEQWSLEFLSFLPEGEPPDSARKRFGRCVTAFLAVADDSTRIERFVSSRDDLPPFFRESTSEPTEWVDQTVTRLFEFGRAHPRLARLFRRADDPAIRLPDACSPEYRTRTLFWSAEMCLVQGLFEEAEIELRSIFDELDDLQGTVDEEWSAMTRSQTHGMLGSVAREQGELAEAIERTEHSLNLNRDLGFTQGQADNLCGLGQIEYERNNVQAAIEAMEESLDLYEDVDDLEGQGNCYGNLALFAVSTGDLVEAVEYAERSLEIREEMGYERGIAQCYEVFGQVGDERGNRSEAKDMYLKALKIAREIGDLHRQANLLCDLGRLELRLGNLDSATEYLAEAVERNEELHDLNNIAICRWYQAETAYERDEFELAREYAETGMEVAESANNERAMAGCLWVRGSIATTNGSIVDGEDDLRMGLEYARKAEDTRLQSKIKDSLDSDSL